MEWELTAGERPDVQPVAMNVVEPQPTEEQWLEQKAFIRYQYLVVGTSLKDLVTSLAPRGLHTKKSQLEYKLKSWSISKNIDQKTWQSIGRKINKRKDEGKDSDVIYCGKRLKQSKIEKEISRHRETNIFAQLAKQRSPPPSPVNSQLIVCTPPSLQMENEWPASLPWFCFRETFWNSALSMSKSSAVAIYETAQLAFPLSTIIGVSDRFEETGTSNCVSKLASNIGNAMPEWCSGEHMQTAQVLLTSPKNEQMPEYLKMMVYRLSNGFDPEDLEEWDTLATLIKIGVMGLQIDLKQVETKNMTIRAFMDTVFKNEIDSATSKDRTSQRPLDLIRWLLKSGQDPNCCLLRRYSSPITPIGCAIDAGNLELVELLLDFQARVGATQADSDGETVISILLSSQNSNAVKLRILAFLFRHRNSISLEEMLCAAIRLRDTDLVSEILQQNIDLTKSFKIQGQYRGGYTDYRSYLDRDTPLSTAAAVGSDFTAFVLGYLPVGHPPSEFVTADVFIAAAIKGDNDTIRLLHEIHPLTDTYNQKRITPLQVAVGNGHLPTCELLLQLYGGMSSALLLIASHYGYDDVLRFLIRSGADVNGTISIDDDKACNHLCAYFRPISHPTCQTILQQILSGMKMEHWDESRSNCVTILIEAGARLTGGEVVACARFWLKEPLETALAAGGNPNEKHPSGRTALQYALDPAGEEYVLKEYPPGGTAKRFGIVEVLLLAGATLAGGEVVEAIREKDLDSTMLLLRHGGSLADMDRWGASCLEAEIFSRNDESLQLLLEESVGGNDAGALCAAIQVEDWTLVGRLLVHRPRQTACHLLEGTAIGLAARSGRLHILRELLTRFVHPSALQSALLPFQISMDGILYNIHEFTHEVDYWRGRPIRSRHGKTCIEGSPLAYAALGEDILAFRELLRNGCQADRVTWVVVAKIEDVSDYLELLSDHQQRPDNIDLSNLKMKTPLFTAIERENNELVQWLVEAGADVNEYDPTVMSNCSPLQLAVKLGNFDMVGYLLEKGANINAPPAFYAGATALQYAALHGHLGLANQLLQHGARVNARGARSYGMTALEGAAKQGRLDMLELLLHHGAVTSGNGYRQLVAAVRFATLETHYAAAEWLKRNTVWTQEDEELMRNGDLVEDGVCKNCHPDCCDEIHGSEDECVHDFSPREEELYDDYCECELVKSQECD